MNTKADKAFAAQVWKLFEAAGDSLHVEVLKEGDDLFEAEIRIPAKGNVGFKITATTVSTQHSEYDPDPRMFGDTAAVTAAAMRDWYPGKVSSWTETKRTVVLQAWNLPDPDLPDYSATYNYHVPGLSQFSPAYKVEAILRLVRQRISAQAVAARRKEEDRYATLVERAFSGLK